MTIAEFLLARIAEDEADAGEAAQEVGWEGWERWARETYAPRVLAECEAKRQIVEWILSNAAEIDGEWGDGHSARDIEAGRCEGHGGEAAATPLRLLASVYADHPDFDPAWRVAD